LNPPQSHPPRGLAARRRRILEAARRVFARPGGATAGLRAIAQEAGVTTGALYSAFDGRRDIVAALQQDALRAAAAEVRTAAEAEPAPADALAAAARALWQALVRAPEPSAALAASAPLSDSLAVLAYAFERLGADGKRARILALSLFAGVSGAAELARSGRDRALGADAQTVLDTLIGVHLSTLPGR
jgi:AcrR family transcriptional regulator